MGHSTWDDVLGRLVFVRIVEAWIHGELTGILKRACLVQVLESPFAGSPFSIGTRGMPANFASGQFVGGVLYKTTPEPPPNTSEAPTLLVVRFHGCALRPKKFWQNVDS